MSYSITQQIKDKATDIGFEKIGITKATATNDEKVRLEKWIKNNHHGSMSWIETVSYTHLTLPTNREV